MGPSSWLTLSSRTRARRRRARRVLWEALECRVVPALSLQPLGLPLDDTLTSLTQPVTQTLSPVLSPIVSTTEPLVEPLTSVAEPLLGTPLTDAIAPDLLESSPTTPTLTSLPGSLLSTPAPGSPAPSPLLGGLLPSLFTPPPAAPTVPGFPSLPNGPQEGEEEENPGVDDRETDVAGRTDEDNLPGQITRGTPPGSPNDADAGIDDSTVAVAPLARAVSGTRPSRGPVAPEFDRGGVRQAELTPGSEGPREDASQPVPVEDPLEEVIYGKRNLLRKPSVTAPPPGDEAGQAAADIAPTEEETGESAPQAGFVAADPLLLILAAGAAVAGTWSQTKRGQVAVARVRDAAFRSRRWLEQTLWRA